MTAVDRSALPDADFRARIAAIEDAEPAPESWEVLRNQAHRLHIHNGVPCCVAGIDDCGPIS